MTVARRRSIEPLWWGLFAAGGLVAALFVPFHIAVLGLLVPTGWVPAEAVSFERVVGLVGNPLVKAYLLVVTVLPLFHWAHRFRFTLVDLGLRRAERLVSFLCYGGAVAGAALAFYVILRLP